MRSETVRYHPVASRGVSGLYFPQTRRSSNKPSQNLTIHGDNGKLQMGGEGGKKEAIYEGSSRNTRSSQLHCHDPETLHSYPEAFSHTELWVGSWGAETNNYSPS